jgi:hypothetical protein
MPSRLFEFSRIAALACVVLPLCLFTGCANPDAHANQMAKTAGLQREQLNTDSFSLTAFSRITRPDLPLDIYIEGDGLAWISRYQPSGDPTPHHALGLLLAAADPSPNIVYLARPCQFTPMTANPRCGVAYWTDKRFSEEVVASMNQAVDHYAALAAGQKINLIGYSGGGAIAVLIAARRNDIATLRTVGGNLDHVEVNRLHQVSGMPGSLNAIDYASRVAAIPQIHFSGADDTVVPPAIGRRFAAAVGPCAGTRVVPEMSHESDWDRLWPDLLKAIPRCAG